MKPHLEFPEFGRARAKLQRPVVIVAGDIRQADYWYRQLQRAPFPGVAATMRRQTGLIPILPGDHPQDLSRKVLVAEEVYFAGTWGRLPIDLLATLGAALHGSTVPVTYVQDPRGVTVAPYGTWWKWSGVASKKRTVWHLGGASVWVPKSACGMRVGPGDCEAWQRYGPPPDACRACEFELSRYAPGTEDEIRHRLAAQEHARALLDVQRMADSEVADSLTRTTFEAMQEMLDATRERG